MVLMDESVVELQAVAAQKEALVKREQYIQSEFDNASFTIDKINSLLPTDNK